MFNTPERIALFIDAGNLAYMTKAMNLRIDFRKFKAFFENRQSRIMYAGYFTGVREDRSVYREDGRAHRELQPLMDWLNDHGYHVVSKPTKEWRQPDGTIKIKGNMDMEMAVAMIQMCETVDRLILVTGDGDFKAIVEYIQGRGRPITVVAGRSSNMLSGELARAANRVIDLADVAVREAICE